MCVSVNVCVYECVCGYPVSVNVYGCECLCAVYVNVFVVIALV